MLLDFVQTATGNEWACAAFLRALVGRGLRTDPGLLCVIDGAKDLRKAMHRLGLVEVLGRSLTTTNCLESIMAQLGQRTEKVDLWRSSEQKQRWVATALLDIEPRLRLIKDYWHLPLLRAALRREAMTLMADQASVARGRWDVASQFQLTMGLTPFQNCR